MAGPRLKPGTSRSKDLARSRPSPPPAAASPESPSRGSTSLHPAPGSTEPHPGGSPLTSPLPSLLLSLKAVPEPYSPWPLPAHPNAGPVLQGPFHTPTSFVTVPKLSFCSSQARRFTVPSSLPLRGPFLPLTLLLATSLPCCSPLQPPRLKLRLLCRDLSQGRGSSLLLGPGLLGGSTGSYEPFLSRKMRTHPISHANSGRPRPLGSW